MQRFRTAVGGTFEEVLRSVQTLGGQLVVAERPQQLADDDVSLLGRGPVPHVA